MKSFLTFERLEKMFKYKPEGSSHMGKKRFFKAVERLLPVRFIAYTKLKMQLSFHFFLSQEDDKTINLKIVQFLH